MWALWVSRDQGLSEIDERTPFRYLFTVYFEYDGMDALREFE